jgi:hypothetical protein
MAIKKSMARNFLLFNYHAFIPIHPPIALTFSTPTPDFASYHVAYGNCRFHNRVPRAFSA